MRLRYDKVRRVLITTDAVGGIWTYALDLARGLRLRGDNVLLASLGPAPSPAQYASAADADVELVNTGLDLDWTVEDQCSLERCASDLAARAVAWRADVVHLSSPAFAGAARFPMQVVGVAHSCVATWWMAMRNGPPPADFVWRIAAVAKGYAACNALVAPTVAFADATYKAYGISPIPLYNGRSHVLADRPMRDICILIAGRLWDEGKGAATLDMAATLLDLPILAIGPVIGPQGQTITFKKLHGVGTKSAADMGKTLIRTRIFVSAARYEPFGLAVLEAAQAGCALVLSDIATFRELWDGAAIFVSPGDAAGFAKTLSTLLNNCKEVERLSALARMRAERYDLESWIGATRELHDACLQRSGVSGAVA
ncbi:glycosyltransferase family 4 protein [Acidisphaera sp. L21]|uniref:glycosyltransferase family 4 protein n=1 Tax=Acidisphaera sp. L21 TaxID=1641851 RepID=UPI00131CB23C|nr:glycosyltransferase family 4 protein [Acidisphaera sp. L21]